MYELHGVFYLFLLFFFTKLLLGDFLEMCLWEHKALKSQELNSMNFLLYTASEWPDKSY